MLLPFLNRHEERRRLERHLNLKTGSFVCLYGRRRCGKSRLLQEVLKKRNAAYYVGDDTSPALQRQALANEIGLLVPGFEKAVYPQWQALLEAWERQAPPGSILAMDEFPALVAAAPELPSVLQKMVDRQSQGNLHTAISGSSQRMMHSLLLDSQAPLYGRATELLKIQPMALEWLFKGLGLRTAADAVEHYAIWGGIPRYWELAAPFKDRDQAIADLVLSPLGVLFREPDRLLRDDLGNSRLATSILILIGQGCHRVSEIAGRLQTNAAALTRPLDLLVQLGLVCREVPYGANPKSTKKTLYGITDPFLRFWYTFVDPHRSRLEAGHIRETQARIQTRWPQHVAMIWEDVVRCQLARCDTVRGTSWTPAQRWWGAGLDRNPMELDVVCHALNDPNHLLVGEAKYSCSAADAKRFITDLQRKALLCPIARDKQVTLALFALHPPRGKRSQEMVNAADLFHPPKAE